MLRLTNDHEPVLTLLFSWRVIVGRESNPNCLNTVQVKLPRFMEHDLPYGVTPSKLIRRQQSANSFYTLTEEEGEQVLTYKW